MYAQGIAKFIDRANSVLPPGFHLQPVEEQRRMYDRLSEAFPFPRPDSVDTEDRTIGSGDARVAMRIYRRRDAAASAPCLIYAHGGGFVLGGIRSHEAIAADLCASTGVTVVLVDFALAPESPFPRQIEDCYATLVALTRSQDSFGIDPQRIGMGGDSSGASIAVATCLMARDRHGPAVRAQVLVSPVLDFSRWERGGEDAPLLTADEMVFFTRSYVGRGNDLQHPYVSPLISASFESLPPAYIMAAERDSLCVDASRYHEALSAAGVGSELTVEPGLVHACLRARAMSPPTMEAFERICDAVRRLI